MERGLLKTFQKMERGKDNDIERANLHKVTETQGNSPTECKTINTTESPRIQKPMNMDEFKRRRRRK